MPSYRYSARDGGGALREGTQEAPSKEAAVMMLANQGMRVREVLEVATAEQSQITERPATSAPAAHAQRTREATHKDRHFWFSQMGSMLRSGIATPRALDQMASRSTHSGLKLASQVMAERTKSGVSLGEAMQDWPDLFPGGQAGAVQAGGEGGYLPAACTAMSDQNISTHKVGRLFWWASMIMLFAPVAWWLTSIAAGYVKAGVENIADMEATGRVEDAMAQGAQDSLSQLPAIASLCALVIFVGIFIWSRSRVSRPVRHRLAADLPFTRKRSRAEGLALFSWHLGELAKAGLSPWQSWKLAAEAIPNLTWRERFRKRAGSPGDAATLSDIARDARLMPDEYVHVLETGEMTGTVPDALRQASQMTMEDAKQTEADLKRRAGCWAYLLLVLTGSGAFIFFYRTYLSAVMDGLMNI